MRGDFSCLCQVAEQLMTIAYESGVNLFDTAEVYSGGKWVMPLICYLSHIHTAFFSALVSCFTQRTQDFSPDQTRIYSPEEPKNERKPWLQRDLHNLIHHWRLHIMFTAQSKFMGLDIVSVSNVGFQSSRVGVNINFKVAGEIMAYSTGGIYPLSHTPSGF